MTATKTAVAALLALVALTGCGANRGLVAPYAAKPKPAAAAQAKFTPGDFDLGPNGSIRYMAFFQGTVTKVTAGQQGAKVVTVETTGDAENDFFSGPLMLNAFAFEAGAADIKVGTKLSGAVHYPFVNTKTQTWINLPKQHLPQGADFKLGR